jgi:glycerol-3-phosphate acyltransferase PlsX
MIAQFAVMGEIYSRIVLHQKNPSVGLLSIGEEELKGNELTRSATPLLKNLGINFIGNVEGRDIYTGKADVIVCDGFIGNVALKVSEGLVDVIKHMLQESLESTITRKIGYVLSKAAYTDFKKRVDYSEYGGAPLVGLDGLCIVGHGRSSAKAVANAVTMAVRAVNEDLLGRLSRDVARIAALPSDPRSSTFAKAAADKPTPDLQPPASR